MIETVAARLRSAGCVFAEDEARLLLEAAGDDAGALGVLVERRAGGVPIEHLLGWAEFCGLRLVVEPGVFVPRRRTELLARQTLSLAGPGSVVIDLCCGAGAVGAVLPAGIELHAVDLDPEAVSCARRNLPGAHLYAGDLYEPLPTGLRADVIAANAPYVPTDAIALMPPEARIHEPRPALDGGADGLDVQRRVVAGARDRLRPGGRLLIESSAEQSGALAAEFRRHGFDPEVIYDEELEATVVKAVVQI